MDVINKNLYKEIRNEIKSQDLVKSNLRLVVHFAKKHQGMGLALDDLVNEGVIGLCKARDNFDSSKNVPFSYYASEWIKAYIKKALNDKSRLIRIPSYKPTNEIQKVCGLDTIYDVACSSSADIIEEDPSIIKLKSKLSMLKPRTKEIVEMNWGIGYEDNFKTTEIATKFGISVQAVTGNIRNAIKFLKLEYEK